MIHLDDKVLNQLTLIFIGILLFQTVEFTHIKVVSYYENSATLTTHPLQTLSGIYDAASHPLQTWDSLSSGLSLYGQQIASGDPEALGSASFEALASLFPVTKVNMINKVAKGTNKLPSQYDGVGALSQLLRDAGVPRTDRLEVINSFNKGSITLRQATGNENTLRFFGGEANEVGRYVTPNFPQGDARRLLSLPPYNTGNRLIQFNLRPGTTFFKGTVAPNFGKPGGGVQYFVPNINDLVTP